MLKNLLQKSFKKKSLQKRNYYIKTIEELNEKIDLIKEKKLFSFCTKLSIREIHENVLVGISLSIEENDTFYVPFIQENVGFLESIDLLKENSFFLKLKELFEDQNIKKISHDVKYHIKNLNRYNVEINNFDDVMVMSYVLYCGKQSTDFSSLVKTFFGKESSTGIQVEKSQQEEELEENEFTLIAERDVTGIGKKKTLFVESSIDLISDYVNQFSLYSLKLYKLFDSQFSRLFKLKEFYNFIELPLVRALSAMEIKGVFVDKQSFDDMEVEYNNKIKILSKKILEESETEDLNINSPHQLGVVLVEKLKIGQDVIKKSEKTGKYLCNSAMLEKLKEVHSIPGDILNYRTLTKIYSTYILGFKKQINPYTNRIHTTFQNALTVTGRLSSVSPNLQNIPNRSDEGRRIRQNIIVPEGCTLVKADYSQVELRILAHVANIEVLRNAFLNDQDVHKITASQVFQIPVEQVTKDLRQKAKSINFGIIYGMSEFGLSKQINVSVKQAKQYIKSYFKQYPGIENYMKNTKKFCEKHGYVNTLFGRRCWIPDINSDNQTKKGFAQRTAINTPIQGTSADITKIAMNNLYKEFERLNMKSKMIIQVHDEIVCEVPNDELEETIKLMKKTMENVAEIGKFSIPLTVDVETSHKWCE
eukprot:gene6022-10024_t